MLRPIHTHWWFAFVCIFLMAIVWFVFGQTLGHDFINYDDDAYVYDSPRVLNGITAPGVKWAFTHSHAYNWHPLTTISHMFDCQLYGSKPAGHHFTSVALHGVAVLLLFFVLGQMTGGPSRTGNIWRSGFVAALFAIHPLHVESVAWIAERKDVLSAVFFMLTLGAYAHYARKPTITRYATMAILFACGLMSKPMLVTLPLVLLLIDYWPLGRFAGAATTTRTLVLEKVPLFALAAASSIITILIQQHGITPLDRLPFTLRVYNASLSGLTYIGQMIWPARLAPFYPYPSGHLSIWIPVFAIAVLAFVSYKAWALRNKYPYFFTGWFWYVVMLLPVIGILQVGLQAHADRYTYLPHIGLYLVGTWAFADLTAQLKYRFAISGTVAVAMIIALTFAAWKQTSHWKNSETLWTHSLAVTSRNDIAHHDLGRVYLNAGKLDEAVANFRAAIEIRPDNAKAHASLATALMGKGNPNEAFLQWQKSLQLQPGNVNARDNLGVALAREGRIHEAMAQWQQSLRYEPNDGSAQNKIAWVLATALDPSLRDGPRAVQLARRVLELSGGRKPAVFQTLAAAYAETGQFSAAIEMAKRGLQLATEQKNFALAEELHKNIALFEMKIPIRDTSLRTYPTLP
jgi:protein O-mannosyl-transferase